jgi:DNA-binding HxlR family transcriptional regulator
MDCEDVNARPFQYTLSLIGGKWKMQIIFWLGKKEVLRYGELKKMLGPITHKMLSNQLKELEQDGLVLRKEYPQVPPKVEYRLSESGNSLTPVMKAICMWGYEHISN